jgi:hypothetical protein
MLAIVIVCNQLLNVTYTLKISNNKKKIYKFHFNELTKII